MKKILYLIVLTSLSSVQLSCARLGMDTVLQDKRTAYQEVETLPDLELPPDLISDVIDKNKVHIPDEEKDISLSTHMQQRVQPISREAGEDGQWLSAQGSRPKIWSRLSAFWKINGYRLELDDMELGVMETAWKSYTVERDQYRSKTRVFIENEETDGKQQTLFVSSIVETKKKGSWHPSTDSDHFTKKTATELNIYLNSTIENLQPPKTANN